MSNLIKGVINFEGNKWFVDFSGNDWEVKIQDKNGTWRDAGHKDGSLMEVLNLGKIISRETPPELALSKASIK